MPSRLRYNTSIEDSQETFQTIRRTSTPPEKKQKMSLSQTYFVAASARTKLGKEACRPDHNLRLLVGHANLLDALMLDLHDAEREQEAWFNQTVQKASSKPEQPKHIQWLDSVDEKMEDADEEYDDEDDVSSESDGEDEEELEVPAIPRRLRSAPFSVFSSQSHNEDELEDDEDDEEHALVRTVSGASAQSPPELVDDSESDDESPPSSPPALQYEFTEAQRKAIATTTLFAADAKSLYTTGTEEMDMSTAIGPNRPRSSPPAESQHGHVSSSDFLWSVTSDERALAY